MKIEYEVGDVTKMNHTLYPVVTIEVEVIRVYTHSFKYKYEVIDKIGKYFYTNDLF